MSITVSAPDNAARPDIFGDIRVEAVNPLRPEVPYFTTVFLGVSAPVDRGQGQTVPGLAVFHNRARLFGGPTYLKVSFVNMVAAASLGNPDLLGHGWEGVVTLTGVYLYGDGTTFLYRGGASDDGRTFFTSFYGARGSLGRWLTEWVRIRVSAGALSYDFARTDLTAGGFSLPRNSTAFVAAVDLSGVNEETFDLFTYTEGYRFGFTLLGLARDSWRDWGLGRAEDRVSGAVLASVGRGVRFLRTHNLLALVKAGWGTGFDGVTKFKLGSGYPPGGYMLPLHGYYFFEMKGDAFVVANLDEGFTLFTNCRFHGYLDAGYVGNRRGPFVPDPFPIGKTVLGLGVALDLRLFGILPVYVAYGYGPLAERMGVRGGHEVIAWIIAGF